MLFYMWLLLSIRLWLRFLRHLSNLQQTVILLLLLFIQSQIRILIIIKYNTQYCSIYKQKEQMADKRIRKQQEQVRRMQREKQMLQQHKDKMMPLVKYLKKEGLIFKYARVGSNRIQYFRLDDFNKLVTANRQKIDKNSVIKDLVASCQNQSNFVYYKRPADTKSLKYPHTLQPTFQSDAEAKFCSFKFDSTVSRKWLMFSIIGGVLALVLFPVWPYALKYAIWLISLYLLIFLVGLLGFRLAVYLVCVIAGFNVWIFPNLLGQYGFIQSFKPVFYAQRWETSKLNVLIRIVVFAILTFYGVQLYLDPTFLQSHFTVTKSTIDDIHDWGVSKIKNEVKFSQRAITNLEDILNQTADVETDNENLHEQQKSNQNENIGGREQDKQNQQQQTAEVDGDL